MEGTRRVTVPGSDSSCPMRLRLAGAEGVEVVVRVSAGVALGTATVPVRRGVVVTVARACVPDTVAVGEGVPEREIRGEALVLGQRLAEWVTVLHTVALRVHCATLGVSTAVPVPPPPPPLSPPALAVPLTDPVILALGVPA